MTRKINIRISKDAETISFDKSLILKKYFYFRKNKKNHFCDLRAFVQFLGNFKSQNISLEGFGFKDVLKKKS